MTNQNLLQMSLGCKQNPMNIILGGNDKGIQLCFNSKGNKKRRNFSYVNKKNWIPPPAKSSRITKHNCLKVPGNDIMLTLPEDGQFLLPHGLPLVIESRNLENFRAAIYPPPQISNNGVQSFGTTSEDVLDDYAKRIKDSHDMQYAVIKESEKMLKEQESKKASLSKQIRSLRKNLEEIGKAIKGIEIYQNVLDRENKRIQFHHCMCNKYIQRSKEDESSEKSAKSAQKMEDLEQVFRQEDSLRDSQDNSRTAPKTYIRPTEISIPPEKVFRKLKKKENLQKAEKQILDSSIQIPDNVEAETTMMKLADNMRKSKQLVDGILVQEEIVDELQKNYIQNVEALYEDQQKMINDMIQAYGSGIISSEEGELESSPDGENKNVGVETYEHTNDESKEFRTCLTTKYKVNSLPNIARVLRNQSIAEKLALANFQAQKLRKEVELLKTKETSKTEPRSDRINTNQVQQIGEADSGIATAVTDSETDTESQFREVTGTVVHKYNILKGYGYQGNVYETTITQQVKDLPTTAEGAKPEFAELTEEERLASLYDAKNAMKKLEETIEKLVTVIPKVREKTRSDPKSPIAVRHHEENISANILKDQEIGRYRKHDHEKTSTTQKVERDSPTQVNHTGEIYVQEVGHTTEGNLQGVSYQQEMDKQETSRQRIDDVQNGILRSEYNDKQNASLKTPIMAKGHEQQADRKLALSKRENELRDSRRVKRVSKAEKSPRTSTIPKRSISDRPIKLTSKGSSGFEVTGNDEFSSTPPLEKQRILPQRASVFEKSQRKEGPVIPPLVREREETQQIHDNRRKITQGENGTESPQQEKKQLYSPEVSSNILESTRISQDAMDQKYTLRDHMPPDIDSIHSNNDEIIEGTIGSSYELETSQQSDQATSRRHPQKDRSSLTRFHAPEIVSKNGSKFSPEKKLSDQDEIIEGSIQNEYELETSRQPNQTVSSERSRKRHKLDAKEKGIYLPEKTSLTKFHLEEDKIVEGSLDSSYELEASQPSGQAIFREQPQNDRSSLTRFHVPEMESKNGSRFSSENGLSDQDEILEGSIQTEYELETSRQPYQTTSNEQPKPYFNHDVYADLNSDDTDEIEEGTIASIYELGKSDESDHSISSNHSQPRFHLNEDAGFTLHAADKYRNGFINLKPNEISAMPSGLQGQRLSIYHENGIPVYGEGRMSFINNGAYGKYQDRAGPSSESYPRGTSAEFALGSINKNDNHVMKSKYQNNYAEGSRFNKQRLRAGSIPVSYQYKKQEFDSIKPRDRAMTFHKLISPRKQNGTGNEKPGSARFNGWKNRNYMLSSDTEQGTTDTYNPYLIASQLRDGRRSTEPEVAIEPKLPNWNNKEQRRRHTFHINEEDKQKRKIRKLYEEIMS